MHVKTQNWQERFDDICFYEEDCMVVGKQKVLNAEHLGDVSGKLIPEIKSFITSLLEERDEMWRERINGANNLLTKDLGLVSSLTVKNVLSDLLKEE